MLSRSICLRLSAVVFAMLLAHFCGSSTAFASCGDYLIDHSADGMSGMQSHDDPQGEEPRPSTSCDGPHCQQLPLLPAPSAPDRMPTSDSDRWGHSGTEPVTLSVTVRAGCGEEPLRLPAAPLSRIDRPPQA